MANLKFTVEIVVDAEDLINELDEGAARKMVLVALAVPIQEFCDTLFQEVTDVEGRPVAVRSVSSLP
jgi:hypothetical protein